MKKALHLRKLNEGKRKDESYKIRKCTNEKKKWSMKVALVLRKRWKIMRSYLLHLLITTWITMCTHIFVSNAQVFFWFKYNCLMFVDFLLRSTYGTRYHRLFFFALFHSLSLSPHIHCLSAIWFTNVVIVFVRS